MLAATLFPSKSERTVRISLARLVQTHGLGMALYTDRAHWAYHTPMAKGPVDKTAPALWLNLLERCFVELDRPQIQQARPRSICAIIAAVTKYVAVSNETPKPSCGPRPPDEILTSVHDLPTLRKVGSER